MIYRSFSFFCILWMLAVGASAQKQGQTKKFSLKKRFISSAGVSYNTLKTSSNKLYGINFTPSLNLLNSFSDFSVSLAVNAAAAYHPASDKDVIKYYSYSFPAFVQMNAGHLASQNFYAAIGFLAGAGYNVSLINGTSDNGFSWTAGFRFWFLKQSFTIRYVQSHLDDADIFLREFSLQINVGRYLQQEKDNNKLSKFVSPFQK